MTTKELVERLLELDPIGDREVVASHDEDTFQNVNWASVEVDPEEPESIGVVWLRLTSD